MARRFDGGLGYAWATGIDPVITGEPPEERVRGSAGLSRTGRV